MKKLLLIGLHSFLQSCYVIGWNVKARKSCASWVVAREANRYLKRWRHSEIIGIFPTEGLQFLDAGAFKQPTFSLALFPQSLVTWSCGGQTCRMLCIVIMRQPYLLVTYLESYFALLFSDRLGSAAKVQDRTGFLCALYPCVHLYLITPNIQVP